MVIDLCEMARFKVREPYLPYGAAAFFAHDKSLVGIFIPRAGDNAHNSEIVNRGAMFVCPEGDSGMLANVLD